LQQVEFEWALYKQTKAPYATIQEHRFGISLTLFGLNYEKLVMLCALEYCELLGSIVSCLELVGWTRVGDLM